MKRVLMILLATMLCLTGCARAAGYHQIDQETAKAMMAKDDGHVIVDVRRQDEYEEGHIPGAILIPNESILATRPEALPDLEQIILVYCRSGNRSRQASEKLAAMGYVNIYEFGGINTWTGEIVTGAARHAATLRVESNPTTGFSWEAVQDVERFDIQDTYEADPQDESIEGAGGVQTFTLTPLEPGTVTVTFTYSRPWEPSDADPRFTCAFEIGEDMAITVSEDGRDQAVGRGYHLEIEIQ